MLSISSVMVDIPGYVFCMVVMECWGRRPILSLCQVLTLTISR